MGLLDKVKAQAATTTAAARDAAKGAAQKGQARLDTIQAKRAADSLLRDLGAAVYAQRTSRGAGGAAAEVERLVTSLRAFEAEHGPIDLGSGDTAGEEADDPGH